MAITYGKQGRSLYPSPSLTLLLFLSNGLLSQFPAQWERHVLSQTVYTCEPAGGLLFAGDPPRGDI